MTMTEKLPLTLQVNSEPYNLYVAPNRTLLEVLREDLGLTGAKEGCGEGVCGSCTVLMDGRPIRSCLTLALEAAGTKITSVEGLARGSEPDPLQKAFINHGAVQCGFCTSGMLMAAKGLLLEDPVPDAAGIKRAMGGNICRCTGYTKILEAVAVAADNPQSQKPGR